MSESFGQRFKDLFGKATNAEIAEKLGYKEDAVSNYARGRIPDGGKLAHIAKVTNCNLHWLLTGEGEMYISSLQTAPSLINEELLAEKVRAIVQEEIQKSKEEDLLLADYETEDLEDIQDLGDADGYDFAKAIEENKTPAEIFKEFFIYNDRADEIDGNFTLSFSGWDKWNDAEKLSQIKNVVETEFIMREHYRNVKEREELKRQNLMKYGNLRRYTKRR